MSDTEIPDVDPWLDPDTAADEILDVWTAGVMSPELFGAILTAGLLVGMWIYSDDMALPTIIALIIIAPVGFAMLPGDLQQFAAGVMAVGAAAAAYEIGRRYVA